MVTAGEATPEEQFEWLRLLEQYWIGPKRGNQISYTLKYHPALLTLEMYRQLISDNVPTIRAVSVLPEVELSYEYEPEEEISRARYDQLMEVIGRRMHEDVDRVHVECEGGSCPISFDEGGDPVREIWKPVLAADGIQLMESLEDRSTPWSAPSWRSNTSEEEKSASLTDVRCCCGSWGTCLPLVSVGVAE